MSKEILTTVAVALVVSIIIISATYFIKNKGVYPTAQQTSTTPQTSPVNKKVNENLINNLPVPANASGVKEAKISYSFSTSVVSLSKSGADTTLKTRIQQASKIPDFVISKDTAIVFNDGGKQTTATTTDLKAGQRIVVITDYNYTSKKWSTRKVHILVGKSLNNTATTSTPSANPK